MRWPMTKNRVALSLSRKTHSGIPRLIIYIFRSHKAEWKKQVCSWNSRSVSPKSQTTGGHCHCFFNSLQTWWPTVQDGLSQIVVPSEQRFFYILLWQHVWVVGLDYNELPSPSRLTRRVPLVGTPTENEASGLISDKSSSKFSAEDLSNYLFLHSGREDPTPVVSVDSMWSRSHAFVRFLADNHQRALPPGRIDWVGGGG